MATLGPARLLRRVKDVFSLCSPCVPEPEHFDFLSYIGEPTAPPHDFQIDGVKWDVAISPESLEEIKKFMLHAKVQYLWVYCLCVDQDTGRSGNLLISRDKPFDPYRIEVCIDDEMSARREEHFMNIQ